MAGLIAGLVTAQFPEFAQQYRQRLGGAVDELARIVADFDASARKAGLDREEALAQMRGTAFLDARQADMRATFARLERLSATQAQMRTGNALTRIAAMLRSADREIARAAWSDFAPALPVTPEGLVFAGGGFVLGAGVLRGVSRLGRRRRRARRT